MKYIDSLLKISLVTLIVSCGSKFEKLPEAESVSNDTIVVDSTPCQYQIHEQQIEIKEVEVQLDSIAKMIKEHKKEKRKLKKKLKDNGYK